MSERRYHQSGRDSETGTRERPFGPDNTETFIFDLETELSSETEKLLANFGVAKIDDDTIEMTLGKDETVNDAIIALNRLDIRVVSMRNKTNRLEELFLDVTKKV